MMRKVLLFGACAHEPAMLTEAEQAAARAEIPHEATMRVDFALTISCPVHEGRFMKFRGELDAARNGVQLGLQLTADSETWDDLAHAEVKKASLGIKAVESGLSVGFRVKPVTPKFCVGDSWKNWEEAAEHTWPDRAKQQGPSPEEMQQLKQFEQMFGGVTVLPAWSGAKVCHVPGFLGCIDVTLANGLPSKVVAQVSTPDGPVDLRLALSSWDQHPEPLDQSAVCQRPKPLTELQALARPGGAADGPVEQSLERGAEEDLEEEEGELARELPAAQKYAVHAARLAAVVGSPQMHELYRELPQPAGWLSSAASFAAGGVLVAGALLLQKQKVAAASELTARGLLDDAQE